MIVTSNMPVSAESINAMLEEVLSEEQRGARAQAESAHQAEQAQLGARVASMRQQAADTMSAGIVSGVTGILGAGLSGVAAFAKHTDGLARGLSALSEASRATGSLINAVGYTHDATMAGIAAEEHQMRASDAAYAAQSANDRRAEIRQTLERVHGLEDRNEETRHSTNSLWRA